MRIHDFAREKLGIHYNLFRYRVMKGKLKLDDYHKIIHYTGLTFEKLFPSPYDLGPPKKITLNLSSKPAATTFPLAEPQDRPIRRASSKKDSQPKQVEAKKEGENSPSTFEFINPFPEGLPD